jgi:hypothetical protein
MRRKMKRQFGVLEDPTHRAPDFAFIHRRPCARAKDPRRQHRPTLLHHLSGSLLLKLAQHLCQRLSDIQIA